MDVKQGDREIHADQVQYDENTGAIKSQGGVDYTDPLVHVTGERRRLLPRRRSGVQVGTVRAADSAPRAAPPTSCNSPRRA